MDNTEFIMLLELNQYYFNLVTNKVIEKLDQLRGEEFLLSGDDSGLKSVWEEVCAQMQGGESFYWQAYLNTIDSHIEVELTNLPKEIIKVLNYIASIDHDEDEVSDSLHIEEIRGQILDKAGYFTNQNISKYLEEEEIEEEEEEDEENNSNNTLTN